jgi:hypothetical protein
MRNSYPATFEKACHALWLVKDMGWSQTATAIAVQLNVGTVSHIVHRRRFADAFPKPLPRSARISRKPKGGR